MTPLLRDSKRLRVLEELLADGRIVDGYREGRRVLLVKISSRDYRHIETFTATADAELSRREKENG